MKRKTIGPAKTTSQNPLLSMPLSYYKLIWCDTHSLLTHSARVEVQNYNTFAGSQRARAATSAAIRVETPPIVETNLGSLSEFRILGNGICALVRGLGH
eukprot:981626-Prorocentrum_minimum.AAC.4